MEWARRAAAAALARIGPRGEAVLTDVLEDPPFPLRWRELLAFLDDLLEDKVFIHSFKDMPEQRGKALLQELADLESRLDAVRLYDRTERWAAAEALGSLSHAPPVSTLPALRRVLRAPDPGSRIAGCHALKAYGPDGQDAVPDLIAMLDDGRSDWHFSHFPGELHILGGSGQSPGGVREAAVEALLAMGPDVEARILRDGIPRLVKGLEEHPIWNDDHAHAAVALGYLGPKAAPAAPALARAYKDADYTLAEALQQTLKQVGADSAPPLVQLLKDKAIRYDSSQVPNIFEILAFLGPKARAVIPDLLALTKDEKPEVREGALGALVRVDPSGETTLPAVLAALKDPTAQVRRKAARGLARLDPPTKLAFPALREMLKDEDAGVGSDAAYALIRLGDGEQATAARLAALIQAAPYNDPALETLHDLGPRAKAAAPALLQRLKSADPTIRLRVADALSAVAPDEAKAAIPVLLQFMEDPHADKDHRTDALRVLLAIGPPERSEAPKVLALLDDPVFQWSNRWPQDELIQLLERMNADRATLLQAYHKGIGNDFTPDALLDTKERVKRLMIELHAQTGFDLGARTVKSLGDIGQPAAAAVPRLKECLDEPAGRPWAAYALLRITGDDDAYLPILIHGVRDDPDASDALAELGPRAKAAVPALIEALGNPSERIRWGAARALGRMGSDAWPAVPGLIKLLGEKPPVDSYFFHAAPRDAAVEALGEIGPAAKDAVPALTTLAHDDDDMVAVAAEKALAKIQKSGGEP
jgi:HEAT repeat protein